VEIRHLKRGRRQGQQQLKNQVNPSQNGYKSRQKKIRQRSVEKDKKSTEIAR